MSTVYKKVSVAIITYNQQDFIAEAIESVLAQDYKNIEVCISDDASTDNTPEIISKYDKLYQDDARVKFKCKLNKINVGIVENYNQVLSLCSGDYIAWLDGDDVFLPGKISAQTSFMEARPRCIVSHTEVEVFNHDTGKILFKNSYIRYPRNGNASTLLRYGTNFANCTTMVRAEWQKKIKFNNKYRILGDWLNKVELLMASGGEINYLDETYSRHRMHGNNNSQQTTSKLISPNVLDLINQYIELLNKYPYLAGDILFGLSRVYRSLGKYNDRAYYSVAFALCPFHWKNLFMLIVMKFKRGVN